MPRHTIHPYQLGHLLQCRHRPRRRQAVSKHKFGNRNLPLRAGLRVDGGVSGEARHEVWLEMLVLEAGAKAGDEAAEVDEADGDGFLWGE